GISRFGSATDFGPRYVEGKWPIKRQRDFAVIQVGGMPEQLTALRTKALDAAVLNAELAIVARKEGFREGAGRLGQGRSHFSDVLHCHNPLLHQAERKHGPEVYSRLCRRSALRQDPASLRRSGAEKKFTERGHCVRQRTVRSLYPAEHSANPETFTGSLENRLGSDG